jgi:hypothetical protein
VCLPIVVGAKSSIWGQSRGEIEQKMVEPNVGKDVLDWTDREVQGSNESSGACLDRAVVGWSGRSIGRAAGIGFGVVSGVHGSRSLRKWFEYRSEFRRSKRICPSRVDARLRTAQGGVRIYSR